MSLQYEDVTHHVIGAFYEVYDELKYGFLETAYRNAMAIALRDRGLFVERERRLTVYFRGQPVGEYRADLICEHKVLIELKAGSALSPTAFAQTLNYLRATNLPVGLLLFFGPKARFDRVVNGASSP